jgi:hypothetical protein
VKIFDWLRDRLRPPRGRVLDPGEEFVLTRGPVRVWDLFLEVRRDRLAVDGRDFTFDELPVRVGRYEIASGRSENTAVVNTVPTPDREFRKDHDFFCESACVPLVSFDFQGIAIAGPRRISVSDSLREDWADDSWVQRKAPKFVVAGYHCLSVDQLRELEPDGADALSLVIENLATGETRRQSVENIVATYRYEVLGISEHPMEPPEPFGEAGEPEFDEHLGSVGGYFHAPMGLFVPEVTGPFELRVHAEMGAVRSNTIVIRIEP